jgi:hypothetical protein
MSHCCPLTIAFLAGIGCTHAARMHREGAASDPAAWSPDDWKPHMAEERQFLWPILVVEGFAADVEQFEREHEVFLYELATFQRIVSTALLASHSAREDRLVGTIVERSRARARRDRGGES